MPVETSCLQRLDRWSCLCDCVIWFVVDVFVLSCIAVFILIIPLIVLNPVDVVRTRMQNQTGKCVIKYPSFTSGLSIIAKEEGFSGLGSGITSSIWRELVYSSIRMGGYEPIRGRIATILDHDPKQTNPLVKYFSAWVSGGVGAAIANPFDLIKTRLQAILPTEVGPYKGTIDAIIKIVKHDGVAGLYKGWAVNSVRAAVLTSSQLGTYDSIKNNIMIKVFHLQEGFLLHLCASMTAGLISTTVTNPVDVVKTRYMTNKGGKFRNPFECTLYVFRHEGLHGFFKVILLTVVLLIKEIVFVEQELMIILFYLFISANRVGLPHIFELVLTRSSHC